MRHSCVVRDIRSPPVHPRVRHTGRHRKMQTSSSMWRNVAAGSSGSRAKASHHCHGAPSSRHFLLSRTYAPAHTCAEKKTRALTHTRLQSTSVLLATQHEQSFTPVHSSPSVALRSFEGDERAGVSERKGKDVGVAAGEWAGERDGKEPEEGRKGGWKGREKRRSRGVALLLVTWNSVPHHRGIRAPSTVPLPPSPHYHPSILTVSSTFLVSPHLRVPTVHPRVAN